MLGMRVHFIFAIGLFNHGGVVTVTCCTNIEIAGSFKFVVRGVTSFAFHAACDMTVCEKLRLLCLDSRTAKHQEKRDESP